MVYKTEQDLRNGLLNKWLQANRDGVELQ